MSFLCLVLHLTSSPNIIPVQWWRMDVPQCSSIQLVKHKRCFQILGGSEFSNHKHSCAGFVWMWHLNSFVWRSKHNCIDHYAASKLSLQMGYQGWMSVPTALHAVGDFYLTHLTGVWSYTLLLTACDGEHVSLSLFFMWGYSLGRQLFRSVFCPYHKGSVLLF